MARSEQRLRGGSGPRSSFVWCAGALVIPRAQRTKCWPRWFRRGQLFRRRAVFWRRGGGTIGGQRLRGRQWPPIQVAWSCSVAFAVSNVQGRGTTRELGLVALNCERIVDNGATLSPFTPVAPHSNVSLPSLQSFAASLPSLHASLLYCCHCLPRSYVQHKNRW